MIQPPMIWMGLFGAVLARIAILMLWYSPMLFWPAWSKATGMSEAKMKDGMALGFGGDVVGSFLMAFVLAHAIFYAGARTLPLGLAVAFVNWLGFVAVALTPIVTYERKPLALAGIYAGHNLVSMLAMGAILTLWGLNWA